MQFIQFLSLPPFHNETNKQLNDNTTNQQKYWRTKLPLMGAAMMAEDAIRTKERDVHHY
jgi:hypothetical protein